MKNNRMKVEKIVNRYIVNINNGQKNTAGIKAKQDIADILTNNGYQQLSFRISKSRLVKLLSTKSKIKKVLKPVHTGDVLFVQYPLYSRYFLRRMQIAAKKKNIKLVGIIHDVEFLRNYLNDEEKSESEIALFNNFDILIAHNDKMIEAMKSRGVTTRMLPLEVFDYLSESDLISPSLDKELLFAGNLKKAPFLDSWNLDININLYGVFPSNSYGRHVHYQGVKTPDELPEFLDGSFGLVWDGDRLETSSGVYGEYTRYNNPHKVSLYLSSGLPVIVWKSAAIATFIQENHLGLVVENLESLPKLVNQLTKSGYDEICSNVRKQALLLRKGHYTLKAAELAITKLNVSR
ncbi:sugar transferase [Lactiplantibacillus plantarum]|nr:sugar transferase [Lactiplantibacillus plantarum]ATI70903.1 hypothetical protein B0667_05195 [Lactiplantibacillus plantarum]MCG3572497.1 sugar transferase [Lactiplantibacillus plantarum]MCZ2137866.1 sugar transferase [Lactiplantibacillus plantarum]MDN7028991.1 hypothetical protein [Lactiplantibacillus plantarum]NSL95879.1 sugar transferase [Lactiplantibacillus plantarum]